MELTPNLGPGDRRPVQPSLREISDPYRWGVRLVGRFSLPGPSRDSATNMTTQTFSTEVTKVR